MFAWIGLALLSISWLIGAGYYHTTAWHAWNASALGNAPLDEQARSRVWVWAATVLIGTVLLGTRRARAPGWKASIVALAMAGPAIWLMPWPYRAAPGMICLGLLLAIVGAGWRAWQRLMAPAAGTCLLAGCVLLGQALALEFYAAETSRGHALPEGLTRLVGGAVRALGIDASVHGSTLAVFSMRGNHLFTASWELLLDPPTCCFLAGAVIILWCKSGAVPPWRGTIGTWCRPFLRLVILVILWLPFRAAVLIALYLENVLRVDYDAPLDAMKVFWNPWVLLAFLVGPVLIASRFAVRAGQVLPAAGSRPAWRWRYAGSVALTVGAVAVAGLGVFWDPVGTRKGGRVLVEEFHEGQDDVWERTDKPFNTEWYGNMSGYNYFCIFDYCSHYYDVSRLIAPVTDAILRDFDVLVVKVPTRNYSSEEIDAMVRFVERGGGLLLIGEHTDVFGTGTHLNSIARRFGFSYRFDCLFGIDTVFKEHFDPPLAPHPIVQDFAAFDFAISCSIDPGSSTGRAVMRNAGLKNLRADYHVDNFYPLPVDSAEMEYGSFIQLWTTRHGEGRVAAFSDSTVFSNFCVFEPGKAELMLGMLEWLNHQGGPTNTRPWLLGSAAVMLLFALGMALGWQASWPLLVAAGLLGWTAAVLGTTAIHHLSMPPAPLKRPLVRVVIDRTLCDCELSDGGFVGGRDDSYGIFERWILRLGYFTSRRVRTDEKYFAGDTIVFFDPHFPLPDGYRDKLVEYVRRGGKVLVVVSPWHSDDAGGGTVSPSTDVKAGPSTANELLEPFGLAVDLAARHSGTLDSGGRWPAIPIARAAAVRGGEPLVWMKPAPSDDSASAGQGSDHGSAKPVACYCDLGAGSVTVVGFGSRFADLSMGVTGDVEPDDALKAVYAVQFGLLRAIVENNWATPAAENK